MDTFVLFTPIRASFDEQEGYQYCFPCRDKDVESVISYFFEKVVNNKGDVHFNIEMTEGVMYYLCFDDCCILFKIRYGSEKFELIGMHFSEQMVLMSWRNIGSLMEYLAANDDISSERRVNFDDSSQPYSSFISESLKNAVKLAVRKSASSLVPVSFITGNNPPSFYGVSEKDILFVQARSSFVQDSHVSRHMVSRECVPFDKKADQSEITGYELEYTDPPKRNFLQSMHNMCIPKQVRYFEFIRQLVIKNSHAVPECISLCDITKQYHDNIDKNAVLFDLDKISEYINK